MSMDFEKHNISTIFLYFTLILLKIIFDFHSCKRNYSKLGRKNQKENFIRISKRPIQESIQIELHLCNDPQL